VIIVVLSERSAGTVLVTFFQDKDLKIEDKYGTTNNVHKVPLTFAPDYR
jgi:hypothetical protein